MTLIPELQRDLVDAAARLRGRRQRFGVRLRLAAVVAAAGALIGATAVLVGRDVFDRAPSSPEPARPRENPPGRTAPPPRRNVEAVPGSFSDPVNFEFGGIRYSIVGFRSRDRAICTRLVELAGPGRPLATHGCAGQRLRRELADDPVRTASGGAAEHVFQAGFARADVTRLALVSPRYPNRVVLSEPWSPGPGRAKPIRFFFVLIDPPPDAPRNFPLRTRLRLEGRLTTGETVEAVP
jgi:hypothetical protein